MLAMDRRAVRLTSSRHAALRAPPRRAVAIHALLKVAAPVPTALMGKPCRRASPPRHAAEPPSA